MTLADIISATLYAWAADEATGRPLAQLVETVLAEPDWLVTYAKTYLPEHTETARQLAGCVAAGIEPETIDGRRWFVPGMVAP